MTTVRHALDALDAAAHPDDVFIATLRASDAAAQAMLDHLADRTDVDAQRRIGLVRGPLEGARDAALQRALDHDSDASDPPPSAG